MFNKFKRAIGVLSKSEYTAITAVDHFNELVKKHNDLAEKYIAAPDSFKRDMIVDLLDNTLNAVLEQATMIVVLLEDEVFKDNFNRVMSKREMQKEKNNALTVIYMTLADEMNDNAFFIDEANNAKMLSLTNAYNWINKVITNKYKDKMIWNAFSKALTTIDNTAPKSAIILANKLIAKCISIVADEDKEKTGEMALHTMLLTMNTSQYHYSLPPLFVNTYIGGYIQLLDSLNKNLESKEKVAA